MSSNGGDEETSESPSAPEAFGALGNEIRLDIIRALAEVRQLAWRWQGMSFAELRKAVGVRDAGNFSYHLNKLRSRFVVKDDDEYKLTYAGMQIARAMAAGTYTERGEHFTTKTDIPCPACDEPLTVTYEYKYLSLFCEDHEVYFGTTLPPGATRERSPERVIDLATLDARQDVECAMEGICPHCWGPMETTVPAETILDMETYELRPTKNDYTWVRFDCTRCGMVFWVPPGSCLLSEPPVIAFFEAHGQDIREISYLELPFGGPDGPTLESSSPVRVRITAELEGDELLVWMDGDGDIVETERHDDSNRLISRSNV
jgi:DNA-binding transcriptional ArsR family regulator